MRHLYNKVGKLAIKKFMKESYRQIKDEWQLAQTLSQENEEIRRCAFQSLNLTTETEAALKHTYKDCIFFRKMLQGGKFLVISG